MNYYERHLGDYARDAGHLSMIEHGAYTLILDRIYTSERGIHADQVHRLCRASTKQERAAVDAVLAEFFTLVGDVWTNGRAEREIAKMRAKVEAARTNGKRGGRPTTTHKEPTGFPLGYQNETQTKALQSPDTSSSQPAVKKKRAEALSCPEGVTETVWSDWLALRKAKKAPVTATVVQSATTEAARAGMTLEAFLRVWCARGSQGLQAEWLKPSERPSAQPITQVVTVPSAAPDKTRQLLEAEAAHRAEVERQRIARKARETA